MNDKGFRGCLFGFLRFCLGFIIGEIVAMILFQCIYPPGGPDYGDGMGYGMAMIFWMCIAGFSCGITGIFIKKTKTP